MDNWQTDATKHYYPPDTQSKKDFFMCLHLDYCWKCSHLLFIGQLEICRVNFDGLIRGTMAIIYMIWLGNYPISGHNIAKNIKNWDFPEDI